MSFASALFLLLVGRRFSLQGDVPAPTRPLNGLAQSRRYLTEQIIKLQSTLVTDSLCFAVLASHCKK